MDISENAMTHRWNHLWVFLPGIIDDLQFLDIHVRHIQVRHAPVTTPMYEHRGSSVTG